MKISPFTSVVYVPIILSNSLLNKSKVTFPSSILWLSLSTLYTFKFPFLRSFVISFVVVLSYSTVISNGVSSKI
jgi:hypothetical protein